MSYPIKFMLNMMIDDKALFWNNGNDFIGLTDPKWESVSREWLDGLQNSKKPYQAFYTDECVIVGYDKNYYFVLKSKYGSIDESKFQSIGKEKVERGYLSEFTKISENDTIFGR